MATFVWNIKIITNNKLDNEMAGGQVLPGPHIACHWASAYWKSDGFCNGFFAENRTTSEDSSFCSWQNELKLLDKWLSFYLTVKTVNCLSIT